MMDKPLFWHQGLFLQPQHLQLSDRYTQSLVAPLNRYIYPHLWGVAQMQVQPAALSNRSIQLARGEFLFPDMTYVSLTDNALIMPRDFSDAWQDGGEHFDVYLGLRQWNPAGSNVTVLPDLNQLTDVTTRFVTHAEARALPDMHQSGPEAQIQDLYYVLKVFWESEKDELGDYDLIPVARLVRDQDDIKLSPHYIAPSLTIGASENLFQHIKEIRDQIGARSRQLEAYKTDRGLHSAQFGARDMVYLLALRSMNRYAPLLEHFTATRQVHPWAVYGMLRQLIGELSTFSGQVSYNGATDQADALPAYDHRQLGACFQALESMVTQLLDQITAGPEYVLPLLFDDTYFAAELPAAMFEGGNRYFMVITSDTEPGALLESLESIAKLGCRESLPILIARSLSGIRMTHLETVPQELPRKAGALYFQLDHHSDQWGQVEKHRNLALYWDTAPKDLKIELMAVGRS